MIAHPDPPILVIVDEAAVVQPVDLGDERISHSSDSMAESILGGRHKLTRVAEGLVDSRLPRREPLLADSLHREEKGSGSATRRTILHINSWSKG